MTIALVQSKQSANASVANVTVTPTSAYGAGNLGVALGRLNAGAATSDTMSDGTNTWTKAGGFFFTGGQYTVLWYCLSLAAGSPGLLWTPDGTTTHNNVLLQVAEFSGGTFTFDTSATVPDTGFQTTSSGSITAAAASELIIGLLNGQNGGWTTVTPGSGYTTLFSDVSNGIISQYNVAGVSGANSFGITITVSADKIAGMVGAFKATDGGGSSLLPQIPPRRSLGGFGF